LARASNHSSSSFSAGISVEARKARARPRASAAKNSSPCPGQRRSAPGARDRPGTKRGLDSRFLLGGLWIRRLCAGSRLPPKEPPYVLARAFQVREPAIFSPHQAAPKPLIWEPGPIRSPAPGAARAPRDRVQARPPGIGVTNINVSGHYKPASNGRNDPATKFYVSRHFSSEQAQP
jgi:hypothetical protein